MRAWLMRRVESVRGAWRTFERFLSDYYRACGVVATTAATAPVRSVYLRTGELLTLEESQGWKTVEVVSGEMWLTQTPATNDLLLGPTSRFEVGGAFPVVIEALGRAEIVLRG